MIRSTGLAILALLCPLVLAGSRAWQPSIAHIRGETGIKFTDDWNYGNGTADAISKRQTVKGITKRYLTIDPNDDTGTRIWPDGVVSFCFETEEAATTLGPFISDAVQLWHDAGLPDEMTFKDYGDCGDYPRSKNPDYLLVILGNALETTIGWPRLTNSGPTMTLNINEKIGHLNPVANVAHELGHSWGLYHEHQNQFFWKSPYVESGGKLFGEDNFFCKNLKDYEEVKAKQNAPTDATKEIRMNAADGPCRDLAAAQLDGFSAANYLPETQDLKFQTNKKIDYNSIMIYPSGAGGVEGEGGTGGRKPILLKPDGSTIDPVTKPSALDIDGLKKLYAFKKSKKFKPKGDASSTDNAKFKAIRRQLPDSGCS